MICLKSNYSIQRQTSNISINQFVESKLYISKSKGLFTFTLYPLGSDTTG